MSNHQNYIQKNGKHISWQHVVDIYNKDTSSPHLGIALCYKLSKQHLFLTPFSKMKVYLAAQVFIKVRILH